MNRSTDNSIPSFSFGQKSLWQKLHIDLPLLGALILVCVLGLVILYSAANEDMNLVLRQAVRLTLAFGVMFLFAQISPHQLRLWGPWVFFLGVILLVAVLLVGDVGKGARRWLDFSFIRFQPSEIMKLAIPIFLATYLHEKPLPPSWISLIVCCGVILVPALLTAKQPDLGTALMLVVSGFCILFLAGLSWKILAALVALASISAPVLWHFLHDYQQQRVLTFLNPERDPLGKGYHIIQSKIAIGSGGLFGKGWMLGTQSHLHFLPEHSTDFIFGVAGEEFGLFGGIVLLLSYLLVIARGLYISAAAQDTFSRLLAGGLSLTFFFFIFVNMGMVCGLLPVVGVPLPLVSYGGTSMVTLMAGFGVLMSIHTRRHLWKR